MGGTLFLGGLSFQATEQDVKGMLDERRLLVDRVNIPLDRDAQRPKGFAFVDLSPHQPTDQALRAITGAEVLGRRITVELKGKGDRRDRGRDRDDRRDDRDRDRDRDERSDRRDRTDVHPSHSGHPSGQPAPSPSGGLSLRTQYP